MSNHLDEVLQAQKEGEGRGIPSICSAHPWVLKAAMQRAALMVKPMLTESTCNQVNQFGGYSGMTPADFAHFARGIALACDLPPELLVLGGDHMGPHVWQAEPTKCAMQKATEMVRAYVQAGYSKLHLDASMKLADDDPSQPLDIELCAGRVAMLAGAAEEQAACIQGSPYDIRYVIGSEVPIPGGAQEHESSMMVTTVESTRQTIDATQRAFSRLGLDSAWERVMAVVIQPGVEFGDDFVLDYNPANARELSRFSETSPFIYEAHSTDYQTRQNLQAMVRDHFAILKVGPALTFAFREAVFSLAKMEDELTPRGKRSNLVKVLDEAMVRHPQHWQRYHPGTPRRQAFMRKYSLSDRSRYYWPEPKVQAALTILLENLSRSTIPLSLLSQFTPLQAAKIREGDIQPTPQDIIMDRIKSVLDDYFTACAG